VHSLGRRAIDSGKRIKFIDVCFPDFFYTFEVFQQDRFSFFADTRDRIQF
jgi:hypothetical protein